jgi:DNA-binding GntR family transcriptional regulator
MHQVQNSPEVATLSADQRTTGPDSDVTTSDSISSPPAPQMPLTRAGAVADELRRMIRSGELAGGTRLRQVDIAERFGVSTTPVREAFTALAREGLVRQDAHRGVIVFAASVADLRENYEIRIALEPLATELAAKQITPAELEELDDLLEQMRAAIQTEPELHSRVLNPRFHAAIYAAANRPRLSDLIANLRASAVSYIALLALEKLPQQYLAAVEAEHEEIVAALRARAPKRAARAMKVHLEHNFKQISASIARLAKDDDGPA